MSIKRLPVRAGDEIDIRDLQASMVELGRIRLGTFNPEGRGRPEKLDRFRLTSDDGRLIHLVAEIYGGEARQYTPQRSNESQWEVITEVNELPVYVPQQQIEPWLEAWRPGTCIRRCDGERERQQDVPCLCNAGKVAAADICKPVVRVQLMLHDVPGYGTWRLESHGTYACAEMSMLAPLVRNAPMPVPAMLRLRQETRRPYDREKRKHVTNTFYVPWLSISAATPAQVALGGDVLTRALAAAGAPQALTAAGSTTGARPALEAAPGADTPPTTPSPVHNVLQASGTPSGADLDAGLVASAQANGRTPAEERNRILTAIEGADLAKLDVIREALKAAGLRDKAVQDAWVSKRAAWVAVLRRDDMYEEAARRGATDVEIQQAGSATHWLADADQAAHEEAQRLSAAQATAGNAEHQQSLRDAVKQQRGPIANMPAQQAERLDALWNHPDAVAAREAGDADPESIANLPPTAAEQALLDEPPPIDAEIVDPEIVDPEIVDPEYQIGDQVTVGGATFTKIGNDPFNPPAGDFDATDEYMAITGLSGQRGWTTAQVNDAIKQYCRVEKVSQASGAQLHAMREAMKRGEL